VPTDRGYRYYVDHVVDVALKLAERRRIERAFEELYQHYQEWPRTAAKLLASVAHTAAVTATLQSSDIYEEGLGEILQQLDQDQWETAREVSVILDAIQEYIPGLAQGLPPRPTVFIGTENPVLRARHTSLIIRKTTLPGGASVLLMITGPKRMSYQRNRALLDFVAELT
jgi:transcriptional regulator of heat shock response